MEHVLITGGAGFVGSNLAVQFKKDNPDWTITTLDNLRRSGSELNITRLRKKEIKFVHGDIRIINDIENVGKFDLLIECSAEPSVLAGYNSSPVYLYQTNLEGTLNCLEICRRNQAGIIYLSSSRVYPIRTISELNYAENETRLKLTPDQKTPGVSEFGFSEEFPIAGIRSLYGASKLCSELMLSEYIAAYDIKGVINRCGVIAGPWQMGKVDQGFVALWLARHLWSGELAYIGYGGKGKQVRDILHVNDLYHLVCSQIEHLDEINGSTFNTGGGMNLSISLCELTQLCREITGHSIPIHSIPETRQSDIPYYVSDCRKIEEKIGWKPYFTKEEIISDTYTWLCENESKLKPILE